MWPRRLASLGLAFAAAATSTSAFTLEWTNTQPFIERPSPAYLNDDPVVLDLCLQISGTAAEFGTDGIEVGIRKVTVEKLGVYPAVDYPLDEINFPASGVLDSDPGTITSAGVGGQWCPEFTFNVVEGEECIYTMCFEGFAVSSGEVTATPQCHLVKVLNKVAYFDADATDQAEFVGLPLEFKPMGGLFFGGWFYPSCDAASDTNMTLAAFVYTRTADVEASATDVTGECPLPGEEGLLVRNSINYKPDSGEFFYYDDWIGAVMSKPEYCCNKWHYVGVSIEEDGSSKLMVDGGSPRLAVEYERDIVKYSVVEFNTKSRPAFDGLPLNSVLRMGPGFHGYADEVSIWNDALTPAEFDEVMKLRTAQSATLAPSGKAPFETLDMNGDLNGGVTAVDMAIPTMVPCVLGMEHNVGPVDGSCVTEIYGWNFADSMFPQCSFGGVATRAEIDAENVLPSVGPAAMFHTAKCTTPGHVSPRFVDVGFSNDGTSFTDFAAVGKTVKHLFLESSLYTTGEGDGGAEADSVCNDLPSKAVSFGAWVCPKCGPPVPPPPPSPAPPPSPSPPPIPFRPPPSSPPPQQFFEGDGGVGK